MKKFVFICYVLSFCMSPMVFSAEIKNISPNQLINKQSNDESFMLIDVRTPEEYKKGHINGAINISVSDIYRRLNEIPKDRELILYCHSGPRAMRALRILSRQGYKYLYHLQGDYSGWIRTRHLIVN